jgi:hypothetical protein
VAARDPRRQRRLLKPEASSGSERDRARRSHVVLELGLGVERLRGRGGDHRGRGRRRGASRKSGENGAGGEDAKAFGHLRVFPILTGVGHVASGAGSIAERRDSINSVLPIGRSANPIALYVLGAAMRKIEEAAHLAQCAKSLRRAMISA